MIDLSTVKQEKAILVGVRLPQDSEEVFKEHLDELELLAQTAGADSIKRITQSLQHPNPKFFIGPGKLEELKKAVEDYEADMIIVDGELSARQTNLLERELKVKILDRTSLILDIFASHAQTAQAKMQVELAQSEYLLPRLTGLWTHLSRQKGGIGMKGPGEKEIETDRRIVRRKIKLLKEKLEHIDRQTTTRRKGRAEKIRVALVGYTNAGKSSLMNVLSDAQVKAENKLFATLDTTVRKVVLDTIPFLLSDTVGFIRKLPHSLVESFKSTLDEAREADILLHVVDISHPTYEAQIEAVNDTLKELGADQKPVILIFNKLDALKMVDEETLEPLTMEQKKKILQESYIGQGVKAVFISVKERFGLADVRKIVAEEVQTLYEIRYPYSPPVG